MSKGYSIDLRERVLQALDEGLSKSAAQRLFHISRSTLNHWLALREQTGIAWKTPPRFYRTNGASGRTA